MAQGRTEWVRNKLEGFIQAYVKANGISRRMATPKYSNYVQGASDFADYMTSPIASDEMNISRWTKALAEYRESLGRDITWQEAAAFKAGFFWESPCPSSTSGERAHEGS